MLSSLHLASPTLDSGVALAIDESFIFSGPALQHAMAYRGRMRHKDVLLQEPQPTGKYRTISQTAIEEGPDKVLILLWVWFTSQCCQSMLW
jgi:hypothetical protein